ncbi:MAG: hypothetical protein ACM3U2_05035, partial [Deltaproteobacteria bacterium]
MAMAVLAGFLSVGSITDWKMLRRRPSKSAMAVTPGFPEHATYSINARLRTGRSESGGAVSLQVA